MGIYQTVCGLLNAFEIHAPSPVRGPGSRALSLVADNPHVWVPGGCAAISLNLATVAQFPESAQAPHSLLAHDVPQG